MSDKRNLRYYWDQFVRGLKPTPETEGYRRLLWTTSANLGNPPTGHIGPKVFDVDGDHLTIMRVSGPIPLLVRLGPNENPFMRVQSRMVIKRPFRQVTFANGNYLLARGPAEGHVLAFASHGPLIDHFPPREYGLKRDPIMLNSLPVTTTTQDIGELILGNVGVPGVLVGITGGIEGATLLLTNTGAADIYIVPMGPAGIQDVATNGYGPISPGATLSLELDDMPFKFYTQVDSGGLGVKTLVGTSSFSVILSAPEQSRFDGLTQIELSGLS